MVEGVVRNLDPVAATEAMRDIMFSPTASLKTGAIGVARIKWKEFVDPMSVIPPFLEKFKQYKVKAVKK